MVKRLSWSEYFMLQALIVRSRSTCDRAYVGAVIVKNNNLIASGYNGSPTGLPHCSGKNGSGHLLDDGGHCVRTVHAEQNALLQCAKNGVSPVDSTVYVSHFPCLICSKLLIQAGVKKIIYYYDYRVDANAVQMLNESGVSLVKYRGDINLNTVKDIVELK